MTLPAVVTASAIERETSPKSSLRYMPGLDVMRGLAILMVMVHHSLIADYTFSPLKVGPITIPLQTLRGYGQYGVHLFFILSGFLITGILIESRKEDGYYGNFYLRRILRIAPAYVLMIAALKAGHWISWSYVVVAMLYLSNLSTTFHVNPEYPSFWSLSVEEHFYLIWPYIVRKFSNRSLVRLGVAMIALTPLLRIALLYGPRMTSDIRYKMWVVDDFFAAGAILAVAVRSPEWSGRLANKVRPLIVSGILLLAVQLLVPVSQSVAISRIRLAMTLEPWLLLFTGLVLFSFLRPGIAKIRGLRPFIFLANISYGLYLIHPLIYTLVDNHWKIGVQGSPGYFTRALARFAVEVGICLAIASLSRRTVEEFFLRMKPKHYPVNVATAA